MPQERLASIVEAHGFLAPGVRAFTTSRAIPGRSRPPFDRFNLGKRCGDDPVAVESNRVALVEAFRMPGSPRWLRQMHGTKAIAYWADNAAPQAEPEADAAFTSEPGVVLAVLSADCLPLLVCAADGSEVAAIHAGWRGLAAGVVDACLGHMRTPPQSLRAWLGPAIGPEAYEVGDEVRDAFCARDANAAAAFRPTRAGHWLCDLYALARRRLGALGVTEISGGDRCTYSEPGRFYSFRRDGVTGRMASVIWIDPTARD